MANDQELIKEVYPISILRASQQNKDEGECWISEDVIKKWTDNPQGVSPEYPYEFCCTRHYTYKNIDNPSEGKEWQPWDTKNISLWAHYGMNAIPYQLLLGNPYESIYQIEASGATREAYVIIDGDGISTGEIILQGGYENKDQKFNLKIDELSILDPISNKEHKFENSNYSSINLGDNWYCRFELSDNNGNPVIKIIGIGPNPESAVTPPSTIQLAPTDSCFKCNLGGKYQKKIIIQAKNKQKNITAAATWTVTAIRDKNGDGIWRYQIMPNIDRVVKMSYFKKISDSQSNHIRSVYNIGNAESVTFDIEKDTYGQAWRNVTNQACRVVIKNPQSGNTITVPANGGPITVPFVQLRSELDAISNANPTLTQTLQYTVELQVVDPDYEANSEGYSVVDKCNLLFEYIVCEAGKDGENGKDGKDGTSSVFNLSNDSGSFAYNYKTGEINLSPNDKTTDIQYSVESNYKCCDSIKIGETLYEKPGEGSYVSEKQGTVYFKLTKNTEYWTLEITSIITSQYESIFAIPITGVVLGKEVGPATFKMTGVKDLNEDGVYSYRLVPEHAYSQENSSTTDYLDVTVFRDVLIEGKGYSKRVNVIVQVISKLDKSILSTSEATEVSCGFPAEIDTLVSMSTIQSHQGVVVKVYTDDEDYKNRPALSENSPYHFTGEAEDIPWTAPQGPSGPSVEVDYEELKKSINTISCSNDNIVVIPGNKYNFKFKDISGSIISKIAFNYSADSASKLSNFFKKSEGGSYFKKLQDGSYELNANPTIQADPFVGTIPYHDSNNEDRSGEITYTWVGDANSDGVYYDYDIEPSAQVLGYTTGENNELVFNIKEITITCKSVRHEGVLKTQTLGSGYILVGSNEPEVNNANVGELKDGQVTITLGKPSEESTEESKNLYYSKKTSFRVYWFTDDKDYEEAYKKDPESIHATTINDKLYYQVDSELINVVPTKIIQGGTITKNYNITGQASRIRNYESLKESEKTYYFYPVGYDSTSDGGDTTGMYKGLNESGDVYLPKYYDIISKYNSSTKKTTYYKCISYQTTIGTPPTIKDLEDTSKWSTADMEDFMAIDSLIANQITAGSVEAEKLLVRDGSPDGTFVAGMINGYDAEAKVGGSSEGEDSGIRIFAGPGPEGKLVTGANFQVHSNGDTFISGGHFSIYGDITDRTASNGNPKSCIEFGIAENDINGVCSKGEPYIRMFDADGNELSMLGTGGLVSAGSFYVKGQYAAGGKYSLTRTEFNDYIRTVGGYVGTPYDTMTNEELFAILCNDLSCYNYAKARNLSEITINHDSGKKFYIQDHCTEGTTYIYNPTGYLNHSGFYDTNGTSVTYYHYKGIEKYITTSSGSVIKSTYNDPFITKYVDVGDTTVPSSSFINSDYIGTIVNGKLVRSLVCGNVLSLNLGYSNFDPDSYSDWTEYISTVQRSIPYNENDLGLYITKPVTYNDYYIEFHHNDTAGFPQIDRWDPELLSQFNIYNLATISSLAMLDSTFSDDTYFQNVTVEGKTYSLLRYTYIYEELCIVTKCGGKFYFVWAKTS